MVTLNPEYPERLDGSKDGNRQIADSDGTDEGQDERMQAAQALRPSAGMPGTVTADTPAPMALPEGTDRDIAPAPPAQRAELPNIPEQPAPTFGTAATTAAKGQYRPVATIVDPKADLPSADPRKAPNGLAMTETAFRLLAKAPHSGGRPAPEATAETSVARSGDGDDDDEKKNNRLRAIVIAVTGSDTQFANAILYPQQVSVRGGPPDTAKQQRIRILQEAADAGYARAQYALARQYIIGEQPQATMREAIMLLREAAESGDVDAQLLLGVIYAEGKIARRDVVESQFYLTLAAAQGTNGIDEAIHEIERDMSLQELIAVRRLGNTYSRILSALDVPKLNGTRGDLLRDELLDAAAAGNTATIARALARGANLEGTDGAGRTAAINAAWRGRSDAIDLLLSVGADIDTRDDRGRTALTWAASNGHIDVVRQLVANGAELDPIDSEGTTPLLRAAWNGHRDVVNALVDAGANSRYSDPQGFTLADYKMRAGATRAALPVVRTSY
jgi:TPR repeat protein